MTRVRQILHVARKDVLVARWWLAAYAGMVAVVTGVAVARPLIELASLLPLAVTFMTLLLAAVLVQADSPARADAFWVTRPLDPEAVLAAKILGMAVFVGGVSLVGQAMVLATYGLTAGQFLRYLGMSASASVSVLFGGLLVATVTKDLKAFILALVGIFVVTGLIAMALSLGPLRVRLPGQENPDGGLRSALFAVAALLVVLHQYRTRRLRRTLLLAALMLALTAVSVEDDAGGAAQAAIPASRPVPQGVPTPPLTLRVTALGREQRIVASLGSQAGGHSYALHLTEVHLHDPAGSVRTVSMERTGWRFGYPLPGPAGRRGVEEPANRMQDVVLDLGLPTADRAALASGSLTLEVEGFVEVWESREEVRVPLAEGAETTSAGQRIRVAGWDTLQGRIQIVRSAVGADGDSTRDWQGLDNRYLLLGRDGTLVPLNRRSGSGSGSGLVLLGGPYGWSERIWLEAGAIGGRSDAHTLTAERLREAEIVRYTWQPIGTYPVRATLAGGTPSGEQAGGS